jgi:hypothetical protein
VRNPSEKLFAVHLSQVDPATGHYFVFVVPNPKREPERGSITFSLCDEHAKVTLASFVYDNCNRKKAHIGCGVHRAPDGMWFFRPVGESDSETEFGALAAACAAFTKEPIWLWINVVAGRDLRAFDLNGKSDPYVVLRCNRQVFKTDTAKKTLAPQWNNSFRIAFWDNEDLLKKDILIEMFDWDSSSKDDFMGVCSVLVEQIVNAPGEFDQWLKLEPDARIKAAKVKGEVHIIAKLLRGPQAKAPAAAPAAAAAASTTTQQ